MQLRSLNRLGTRSIAEPFAGGAGASLTLLFREEVPEIYINDADPAIRDLWWVLVNETDAFADLLSNADLTMREWERQRDIYRTGDAATRLDRAFATFYLNRCNRSGIIMNGGPIGGVKQTGKWKIDARFNKTELLSRCERIREYRDRIHVSGLDGAAFIRSHDDDRTLYFIDPPYFGKGRTLYMDVADGTYHARLSALLKSMEGAAWVLTYDDCPDIRELYAGWAAIRPFGLQYAASERRRGREVLVSPTWMQHPTSQDSAAISW